MQCETQESNGVTQYYCDLTNCLDFECKCNCGCHFFMHVLVVSDSGTEFVGLSCINCHRSDICFKDEADAALKTGVWADYETFMDKAFLWDSYVGADGKPL